MIPLPKSCLKDAPFVLVEFSYLLTVIGINAKPPFEREVVDQLRKNQRLLVGVLRDGLKPSDFRKLMKHLRESGLAI
jgi:hypothetical protein